MSKRVLILGASGKVGRHSAAAFQQVAWDVRLFDRQNDDLATAARGCDVIVNGMNPPNYHNWQEIIPKITSDVIAAAKGAGATVILPGNVYHFGNRGGVWSEKTEPKPCSRKGEIRLRMEKQYAQSGVQTIVLRAGNFMDPQGADDVMSMIYLSKIKRGKITLPNAPDVRQAMCYLPDWARATVKLAEMRKTLDQFEDIPFPGHTLTGFALKERLEKVLKRDVSFARFPWWLLTITAPFWELARELKEMRYLWDTDHVLSGERFDQLLPDFRATPMDDALSALLS